MGDRVFYELPARGIHVQNWIALVGFSVNYLVAAG
jgi:hypothetical protein